MKAAIATVFVMLAGHAAATPTDDFVACLIGQSAVALHAGASDAVSAQEAASERCDEPKEVADNPEADGLYDYVNLMVERMAAE